MAIFKKKKQTDQPAKPQNYTDWEKDFGFLNLVLTRKKNITKQFLISVFNNQKADKDYLSDEELDPIITNIVNEVNSQIGSEYKDFLITKYFGTEKNFLIFVTEDVYVDLISDAINRNIKKINNTLKRRVVDNVLKSSKTI